MSSSYYYYLDLICSVSFSYFLVIYSYITLSIINTTSKISPYETAIFLTISMQHDLKLSFMLPNIFNGNFFILILLESMSSNYSNWPPWTVNELDSSSTTRRLLIGILYSSNSSISIISLFFSSLSFLISNLSYITVFSMK